VARIEALRSALLLVEQSLSLGSHPFAPIIRRELQEAALATCALQGQRAQLSKSPPQPDYEPRYAPSACHWSGDQLFWARRLRALGVSAATVPVTASNAKKLTKAIDAAPTDTTLATNAREPIEALIRLQNPGRSDPTKRKRLRLRHV
jgi:hypothetical protein